MNTSFVKIEQFIFNGLNYKIIFILTIMSGDEYLNKLEIINIYNNNFGNRLHYYAMQIP